MDYLSNRSAIEPDDGEFRKRGHIVSVELVNTL
jgi:hypothetical protein